MSHANSIFKRSPANDAHAVAVVETLSWAEPHQLYRNLAGSDVLPASDRSLGEIKEWLTYICAADGVNAEPNSVIYAPIVERVAIRFGVRGMIGLRSLIESDGYYGNHGDGDGYKYKRGQEHRQQDG